MNTLHQHLRLLSLSLSLKQEHTPSPSLSISNLHSISLFLRLKSSILVISWTSLILHLNLDLHQRTPLTKSISKWLYLLFLFMIWKSRVKNLGEFCTALRIPVASFWVFTNLNIGLHIGFVLLYGFKHRASEFNLCLFYLGLVWFKWFDSIKNSKNSSYLCPVPESRK